MDHWPVGRVRCALRYRLCARRGVFVLRRAHTAVGGLCGGYGDFCQGRAHAFAQYAIPKSAMPAATGIGSRGGGIAFFFVACRSHTGLNIENPRQLPAYNYPRRYGPESPSFARATYLPMPGADDAVGQLYVSGTASVLGHETAHEGDVEKQCDVTLENMVYLVSAANLSSYGIASGYRLSDLRNIKVYVRHRDDLESVRRMCDDAFSPAADVVFLNVDICRADLLVEIEGIIF